METGDYIVHIVDDEEAVRKSLAFLLTMSGFAVKLDESATDFLAVASGIRNGVLVTDLRMPDMTGWSSCETSSAQTHRFRPLSSPVTAMSPWRLRR